MTPSIRTLLAAAAITLLGALAGCHSKPSGAVPSASAPALRPALAGATFPVNIAAPSFIIDEPGSDYYAEFGITGSDPQFGVGSADGAVCPPLAKWHTLLRAAAPGSIYIRVTLRRPDGRAEQLADVVCTVSPDSIDPYLVYRLLYPGYELWNEMGIYQRSLESYDEVAVVDNRDIQKKCVNCHSFVAGSPDTMMLHVRGPGGGTVISRDGKAVKVNPKCPALDNGATYPAWHPSGRWIAFSANNIQQVFHLAGTKTIEVADMSADMTLYDVSADSAVAVPGLNGPEWMETFPAWAPDGRRLFFTRAATPASGADIDSIRYALCAVSFDPATRTWGEPEVIFDAPARGRSVSFPRVHPSGRWLLFTLADYGNFSIWHPEADLWLMDLADGSVRTADPINSPDVDSYHSWSSDGRWVVFSSKRLDGLWARPFIAAFDEAAGTFGVPFLLPQADPRFYDAFMRTYNIPELIRRPILNSAALTTAAK